MAHSKLRLIYKLFTMKNFASNLEKRMIKTFAEHEMMYANHPFQNYHQNTEVIHTEMLGEISKILRIHLVA